MAYETPNHLTRRQQLLITISGFGFEADSTEQETGLASQENALAQLKTWTPSETEFDDTPEALPIIELPALRMPEYIDLTAANDEEAPALNAQVKVVMERTENPYLSEAFAACGLEAHVAAYTLKPDLAASRPRSVRL